MNDARCLSERSKNKTKIKIKQTQIKQTSYIFLKISRVVLMTLILC